MKAAFATWGNRIAPVFDVARHIHVVEVESGRVIKKRNEILADAFPAHKALRLAELGVEVLVCGAISRPMRSMIVAYGIRVVPFVAGEVEVLVNAWIAGRLEDGLFAMPGCHGERQRRFRGGRIRPR